MFAFCFLLYGCVSTNKTELFGLKSEGIQLAASENVAPLKLQEDMGAKKVTNKMNEQTNLPIVLLMEFESID